MWQFLIGVLMVKVTLALTVRVEIFREYVPNELHNTGRGGGGGDLAAPGNKPCSMFLSPISYILVVF